MQLSTKESRRLLDQLDTRLDSLRSTFREKAALEDPIGLVYRYSNPRDIEVAALICSSLAYGQRKVFVPIASRILDEMGSSPYDFVMSQSRPNRNSFDWFKYRFNRPEDLDCLFYSVRHALQIYGSLESAFVMDSDPGSKTVFSSLRTFVAIIRGLDFSPVGLPVEGTPGFRYLFPDPSLGGACKRLNMFLRWMLRKDEVDLGIWSGVPLNKLVVPLDTHVQHVSLALGLTEKKGSTWLTASDITHSLTQLDSVDPLKYDFLLFSMGVEKTI